MVKRTTHRLKRMAVMAAGFMFTFAGGQTLAQQAVGGNTGQGAEEIEEIVVLGIKGSLKKAMEMKRDSDQILDAITAEDIGKLPDYNAARALQRVTGVQISNRNGIGSSVNIRGFTQVNVEFNGRNYVGQNSAPGFTQPVDRQLSLEDIPSDLLAAVEVIKAPTASDREGALGGTIRFRTRDPLDLDKDEWTLAGVLKNSYSEAADADDQNASIFVGRNWDDRFGFVLNVTDGTSTIRNDQLGYRDWGVIGFANRDTGALEVPVLQDSQGRQAAVIAPRLVELFQRKVIQDQTAINFNLQIKPQENMNIWSEMFYTEYEQLVSEQILSLGINDINNGGLHADGFSNDGTTAQPALGTTQAPITGSFTSAVPDGVTEGLGLDGDVTLLAGGFEIPDNFNNGDSDGRVGQIGVRDVRNQNVSVGGSWWNDDLVVSTYFSHGESEYDSVYINAGIKGSYGNIDGAFRDPRPLDPYSGLPVPLAQHIRWGYNLTRGEFGSVFLNENLRGVNPSISDGGDYLTDPYSYALGFVGLWKDQFISEENAFVVDFEHDWQWQFINGLEWGIRVADRKNGRTVSRGVGEHFQHQCSVDDNRATVIRDSNGDPLQPIVGVGDTDAVGCANAGGNFTRDRIGAEEANSIYVQPAVRQNFVGISDGSYLELVNDGNFPAQWLVGNPDVIAGDPLGGLAEIFGVRPRRDLRQDYLIDEQTQAAYIQANFAALDGDLSGNFGVRVVNTNTDSFAYELVNDNVPSQILFDDLYRDADLIKVKQSNDYSNVLPSVNINWALRDDLILRFAANKTMARPNLTDLIATQVVTDVNALRGLAGNPNLDPFESTNLDVSAEWYFDEENAGSLTGAIFAKDLTSFITTRLFLDDCVARGNEAICEFRQPINGSGEATGFEVGYNQPLPMGFGIVTNYTWIDSEADNGLTVPDLSENSYNLIAYWENYGFGARLAYNWRESRLLAAQGYEGRPIYMDDFGQLDFTLNYDVNDYLSLTMNVINLTEEVEQSFTQISERVTQVQQFDRVIEFLVRGRW